MTIDSYRLDLPMSWVQVPVDPDKFRETVRARIPEEEWATVSTAERRRAELFVERVVSDLRASDARFAASLIDKVPDSEEGAGDGGLIIAGVVMSMMHRSQLKSPVPLTIEVVHTAMSRSDAPLDKWTRSRSTNLEPPTIVNLPAGRAVHVVRLVERGDAASASQFFSDTYLIPMPEDFEHLLVVQFATPNIEDSRAFSGLFAAIAKTLKAYRVGEPTTL